MIHHAAPGSLDKTGICHEGEVRSIWITPESVLASLTFCISQGRAYTVHQPLLNTGRTGPKANLQNLLLMHAIAWRLQATHCAETQLAIDHVRKRPSFRKSALTIAGFTSICQRWNMISYRERIFACHYRNLNPADDFIHEILQTRK